MDAFESAMRADAEAGYPPERWAWETKTSLLGLLQYANKLDELTDDEVEQLWDTVKILAKVGE